MKATIQPSKLKGTIQAPASKSSMQRACAAALLKEGESIIHHPGHSNDDLAAMDIIQKLGAQIEKLEDGGLRINSKGVQPIGEEINCGESGLSIRMFTPIVALSNKEITVNGSGSLATRPMDFFDHILPKLKVKVKSNNGKLPLLIKGPLQPETIEVDGSLSSQFLTGLLMAYGATNATGVTIKVNNLQSKPYIDLTLKVMWEFGLRIPENKDYKEFKFSPLTVSCKPKTVDYSVEGDWSGGAFLLVAGAIAGPITVRGLDLNSTQGDKTILEALMNANAAIAMEAKGIKIHPDQLNGFDFDATDCPDLFPPLVALAAYCKGKTRIKGVNRLTHKESNRALTLQEEFGKMGVQIELKDDVMLINGTGIVNGAEVRSHHDHRIAMALAVAALKAKGATIINEAESVKKSYPDFYDDLKKLGAKVSLNNKIKIS